MNYMTRKDLIRELDLIVSLIVRKRHPYCVQCGSKTNLTCGHVITRKIYSTRWALNNCYTQCKGHNLNHKYEFHHYINWYIQEHGLNAWNTLYKQSTNKKKFTDAELQTLLNDLIFFYNQNYS